MLLYKLLYSGFFEGGNFHESIAIRKNFPPRKNPLYGILSVYYYACMSVRNSMISSLMESQECSKIHPYSVYCCDGLQ